MNFCKEFGCDFYINEYCTDSESYVDSKGEVCCRYHYNSIRVKKTDLFTALSYWKEILDDAQCVVYYENLHEQCQEDLFYSYINKNITYGEYKELMMNILDYTEEEVGWSLHNA